VIHDLTKIDQLFEELNSKDGKIRHNALLEIIEITNNKVVWVYDKWYVLQDKLLPDNSYQRSIGLMLLANLAKSDVENRMGAILDNYFTFFNDEKFITSRQCLQNVWKIAVCHTSNGIRVVKELEKTYFENIYLALHGNLIKEDVIFSLVQIAKHSQDKSALQKANELIDHEIDDKLIKSLRKILIK
jgi:hypothetical protein